MSVERANAVRTFDPRPFIERHEWRFAKTMPQWPHWYCLRRTCDSDEEFMLFVRHIYSFGLHRRWHGRPRVYLEIGDYKYWTLDHPLETTNLINRALIADGDGPSPESLR